MMFEKNRKRLIHIKLSDDEYNNMKKVSNYNGITYSNLIRSLLNDYCNKYKFDEIEFEK